MSLMYKPRWEQVESVLNYDAESYDAPDRLMVWVVGFLGPDGVADDFPPIKWAGNTERRECIARDTFKQTGEVLHGLAAMCSTAAKEYDDGDVETWRDAEINHEMRAKEMRWMARHLAWRSGRGESGAFYGWMSDPDKGSSQLRKPQQ
jgi:hypothetical protein